MCKRIWFGSRSIQNSEQRTTSSNCSNSMASSSAARGRKSAEPALIWTLQRRRSSRPRKQFEKRCEHPPWPSESRRPSLLLCPVRTDATLFAFAHFTMQVHRLHSWDLTPTEAVQLQRQLADRVDAQTPLPKWDLVAGADMSYNRNEPIFYATVVVYRVSSGEVVDASDAVGRCNFPYVPGLFSFREAPGATGCIRSPRDDSRRHHGRRPRDRASAPGGDCESSGTVSECADGGLRKVAPLRNAQGTKGWGWFEVAADAPRRTDRLCRSHEEEYQAALRLSGASNRLGERAVEVVLGTTKGYRLPEPARLAHLRVNDLRRRGTCTTNDESL